MNKAILDELEEKIGEYMTYSSSSIRAKEEKEIMDLIQKLRDENVLEVKLIRRTATSDYREGNHYELLNNTAELFAFFRGVSRLSEIDLEIIKKLGYEIKEVE